MMDAITFDEFMNRRPRAKTKDLEEAAVEVPDTFPDEWVGTDADTSEAAKEADDNRWRFRFVVRKWWSPRGTQFTTMKSSFEHIQQMYLNAQSKADGNLWLKHPEGVDVIPWKAMRNPEMIK